ncbi:MAG: DUF5067 domain-containing protein [Oscillospiraceae bacterium]|nr:DUF5067 domain-containing protein [Oscillospiraceae bacterium]
MKKILSSILLLMTAVLLCSGCSGESTPKNYYNDSVYITPINTRYDVISIKERAASHKDKTGTLKVKEAYLSDTFFLYVTYIFTNNESSATSMGSTISYSALNAFQNGIQLDSSTVSDENEYTDILSGASVEIQKKYAIKNIEDPVTLLVENSFYEITYISKEITFGKKMDEQYIENSPYSCSLTGAGITADGQIVIDYSFTKTTPEGDVVPAKVLAIQAYQGTERLAKTNETMTDESHYLKNYIAQPNQKVDLSTTFRLNNSTEDVTVYLTDPDTAQIYSKETYSVK